MRILERTDEMADATDPYLQDEAGTERPRPPRPRFAPAPVDEGAGAPEDETHDGSLALLAAWG